MSSPSHHRGVLHRSYSLPLPGVGFAQTAAPELMSDAKRAKTTDDIDTIPFSWSAENLVPCGFASDEDDDETMDGWVTADDDNTDFEDDDANRCIECGIDMGIHNPRQYCGKTHCSNGRGSWW